MDLPPFFNFLNNLKEIIPIITPNYYVINNNFYEVLPAELESIIDDYKIWEYHNLRSFQEQRS